MEKRGVELHCLVFLRNDIYDHLIHELSDRGKDTSIVLDWPDPEVFKQLVVERLKATDEFEGDFEDMWPQIFASHVGVQESFSYMLDHTLMRPRDLLNLIHRGIEVAVNRGHKRVEEEDIRQAVRVYSEDLLYETSFELRDVFPGVPDPLYVFLGAPHILGEDELKRRLAEAGIEGGQIEDAVLLLVWFGFLGVQEARQDEPRYSYHVRYNVDKLLASARLHGGSFVVHPGFRGALETSVEHA
jgi:hypothetical protein